MSDLTDTKDKVLETKVDDIKEEDDDETILKSKRVKQVCSQKKLDALKNNRIKAEEGKKKNKEIIESGESDSEDEVVVVKKKKKVKEVPKKKKKIITIEISDSESESEDEPEPVKQAPLKPRQMVTQQNKKSLIKVHKPVEQINYFCD